MGKLIDLTGQRFGSLVVLEKTESRKVKHGTVARWKCKCDCGKIKVVDGTGLREGRIKTCGTHKKEYIGQRYGRLVVLEELKTTRKNGVNTRWFKCKCDCGNIVNVRQSNLVTETRSCGCYKRDSARERQTIHGMNGTRVWNIYYQMKQRCYNTNHTEYHNYGGRGITICDEWLDENDGAKRFFEWASANGYKDNLTIDRVDNNRGYSPDNCRWVTRYEQSRNRRTNVIVEYKGQQMILKDFSKLTGVNRNTASKMLKQGKSVDEIVERYGK